MLRARGEGGIHAGDAEYGGEHVEVAEVARDLDAQLRGALTRIPRRACVRACARAATLTMSATKLAAAATRMAPDGSSSRGQTISTTNIICE
jgi:hypothetical protein